MNLAHACNLLLDAAATPPDWIELLPVGPVITGLDGRRWLLRDPPALVAAFQRRELPMVIDWEHASEHRAPHGLDAPAAGWIDKLELRGGAVWGHVDWTERAAQQIRAREYRYLSPVFTYQKTDKAIVALTSAGLTNQPNLTLTALNHQESPLMSVPEALWAALNLPATATEQDALNALAALRTDLATARNRAETPPLEKFIPRADYDQALARATHAEQKLADLETAQRQAQIDALIEKALQARQIAPATESYYRAMCQLENGLAEFGKFIAKAPPVIGGDSGLEGKPPPTSTALNRTAFEALTPQQARAHLANGGQVTD
jgi:phage I-like protein